MFQDKKENALYITHRTELLVWLIVILIIVSTSSLGFIHKTKNAENDYRVFLPDVDGLIVGSPVRMMGVQVGHVVKIKPVKDEVYVKFLITHPDVYIPQGSEITVEFSGMAGSKSLELYLPDKNTYIDKNVPVVKVNSPKRLYEAMSLLDDMYKKMGSIIYSCSSFGKKLSEHDLTLGKGSGNREDIKGFLKFADKFLDDSNKKAIEMRKRLEDLKGDRK